MSNSTPTVENPLAWHRTLEQAIASWSPAQHASDVKLAEEERSQILDSFPLAAWPSMELEQFAQGAAEEKGSFCSWLEHRSPHLGLLPARNASIHLIYKEGGETWKFPNKYKSVEHAWKEVREAYVRAFELAGDEKLADIDAIPAFRSGSLTLHKALHVYFPDRFLPVSAKNHMEFMARRVLRDEWESHKGLEFCELNSRTLAALRSRPGLTGCSSVELMYFLYDWTDPRKTPDVFKVAPGDGAKFWAECEAGGYVCIGWDDDGALTQFESEQEFAPVFEKRYGAMYNHHKPTITRKRREVWALREMSTKEPGTVILANQGTSRIVGVGKVVSPGYVWLGDRPEYKHGVRVAWQPESDLDVPHQGSWALSTVLSIEPHQFDEVLGGYKARPRIGLPLNLILYGPPGTGKTYRMREMRQEFAPEPAAPAGSPAVDVADLTWFEVVALALHDLAEPSVAPEIQGHPLVQAKYVERAPKTKLGPFVWQVLQSHTVKGSKTVKYQFRTGQLVFDRKPDGRWHLPNGLPEGLAEKAGIEQAAAEKTEAIPDNQFFVTFHPSFTYEDFVEGIKPESPEGDDESTVLYPLRPGVFKQACERAVQLAGFKEGLAAFCQLKSAERRAMLAQAPPAVLFVDEINRGNVARILGELITLIEPDKRLGAEQELIVTLPGSRQRFGVPANLWIIGTMNTADRSVVALDTALRRRFAFRECPPEPQLLDGVSVEGVEIRKLLEAINRRLLVLRDRDHLIGHACFMPMAQQGGLRTLLELRRVFREHIVPLLLEYFHDDLGRVGLVLGGAFVKKLDGMTKFAADFEHDQGEDLAERPVYELADVDSLPAEAFKAAYA